MLQHRIAEGKKAPKRTRTIPGGFNYEPKVANSHDSNGHLIWTRGAYHCAARYQQHGNGYHEGGVGGKQTLRDHRVGVRATAAGAS